MYRHRTRLSRLAALATLLVCTAAQADEAVRGAHEAVIAGHPLATQIGLDVLHRGGTAADALVAVSLALNAAEPGNSGLGGKMVLLYYDAQQRTVTDVTAMAAAPLAMDDARLAALPAGGRSRGWSAVCTPGLAAGLGEAHHRWGKLQWRDLVEPAAKLAEDGFTLSPAAAALLLDYHPGLDPAADAIYAPDHKTPLTAGAVLRNPDLGHTLRLLADGGPDAFYHGEIADRLVAGDRAGGGCLTADDLARYHARVLAPLHVQFDDYDAYSSAPPLNGGATVLAALACLSGHRWAGVEPRSPAFADAVARVLQQVYPEVNRSAADVPDSADRVAKLLAFPNVAKLIVRARSADPAHPFPTRTAATQHDAGHTTHLVIVDRAGNIACCTQSLGLHFGARVVAPGTGFLLNADLDNFDPPGSHGIDSVAPGKWPGSTMAPTIFLHGGRPVLAIGSPASSRIPTAVLQVSLDVLEFHTPLSDAIRHPRFHVRSVTKGVANIVEVEPTMPAAFNADLSKLGWDVRPVATPRTYWGSVNAVQFNADGTLTAVADQRRASDAGGD